MDGSELKRVIVALTPSIGARLGRDEQAIQLGPQEVIPRRRIALQVLQ
jgi:hypothetical protein